MADVSPYAKAVNPNQLLKNKIQDQHLQKLTSLETSTLKSLFVSLQQNSEKTIPKESFTKLLMKSSALFQEESVLDSFYSALDINNDGCVDKKELVCGLLALSEGSLEKKLGICFSIFDLNNDGSIQKDELTIMIRSIMKIQQNLNEQQLENTVTSFVDSVFSEFDTNHDNELSFEEFSQASLKRPDILSYFTLEDLQTKQ